MEDLFARYVEKLVTYNNIASTDSSKVRSIVNHKLTEQYQETSSSSPLIRKKLQRAVSLPVIRLSKESKLNKFTMQDEAGQYNSHPYLPVRHYLSGTSTFIRPL